MSRLLDAANFVAEKLSWHQRIAHDPKLSLAAKAVAGLILHDLNTQQGGAWRGQDSMAKLLGLSDRHLRRLLNELKNAGYVEVEVGRGRGRTNFCRATWPNDGEDGPTGNRAPTSAEKRETRTPTADQTERRRTPVSQKADRAVRQYLYDPIRKIAGVKATTARPAVIAPFPEPALRDRVIQIAGVNAAISYLDPARWDAREKRIVCKSRIGFSRLQEIAGRVLEAAGVTIILDCSSNPPVAA